MSLADYLTEMSMKILHKLVKVHRCKWQYFSYVKSDPMRCYLLVFGEVLT